jgi:hypothetical protein
MDRVTERPTVVVELAADARHAGDLSAGGIFVDDCALALDDECDLLVRGTSGELRLQARVAFVDIGRGAGLVLIGPRPAIKDQLAALIAATQATRPLAIGSDASIVPSAFHDEPLAIGSDASIVPSELEDGDDDIAVIHSPPIHDMDGDEYRDGGAIDDHVDEAAIAARRVGDDVAGGHHDRDADDAGDDRKSVPANLHERLRHLTLAQQLKKAHTGELHERIVLERMYGKSVWDALLRNPRVTAPEVARIARMAQLPRPLIELIVGNGAWLQVPEVRRALLANPRLATDQILRVLRLVPKHELKLAAMQTAYSHAVRDAAKRLLKEP